MNIFKDMKVKTKLVGTFLCIIILIGIIAGVGLKNLSNTTLSCDNMYNSNLISVDLIHSVKENLLNIGLDMSELINEKDKGKASRLIDSIHKYQENDNKLLYEYNNTDGGSDDWLEGEEQVYNKFINQLNGYRKSREKVISLIQDGRKEEALSLYSNTLEELNSVFVSLNKIIQLNSNGAKQDNIINQQIYRKNFALIMGLSIVALIFAGILSSIITRQIESSLTEINNFAKRLSNCDFTSNIDSNSKDEFGQTLASLNKAQFHMKQVIQAIMENCSDVSSLSEEVYSSVEEIDAKMQNINASVDEISSGIEETSSISQQIYSSEEEIDVGIKELTKKTYEENENSSKIRNRAVEAQVKVEDSIETIQKLFMEKQKKY
ncbi:HAMP domain-containing methyl-accepting chemotaxis protein [Clostridium ljungdahlii]|nr:methyl-accepting chemotaxis protein [Clostridium ljungdahlii]